MTNSQKYSIGFMLCLMLLSGGCTTKQRIGEFFLTAEGEPKRPTVSVGHFFVRYASEKYSDSRSLAGMLEKGLNTNKGREKIRTINQAGLDRRNALLRVFDQSIKGNKSFVVIPRPEGHELAAMGLYAADRQTYAERTGADLVLFVTTNLSFRNDKWIGKLGDSWVVLSQMWQFYDSDGEFVGGIRASDEIGEKLKIGLYDTREDRFADKYYELMDSVTEKMFVALEEEIDKAKSKLVSDKSGQ